MSSVSDQRPDVHPGDRVRILARPGWDASGERRPAGQVGTVLPPGHLAKWAEENPAAEPGTRVIAVRADEGVVMDATGWERLP